MERITQFALANSRLTILLLLLTFLAGIHTFVTMPSQEDPEITIRTAKVWAQYPGMTTTQLEDLIAKPLERKIGEIPELEKIQTLISDSSVILTVEIEDKYFDLDQIWQNLRNKMNDIERELPQGTLGPFVNDDFGRVAAATVALYGRGYELSELRDIALDWQDKLGLLDKVSKIELYGVQDEKIYLEFNPARLAYYGIDHQEIIRSLQQQNVLLPGGSVVAEDRQIAILPSGNFESLDEIRNLQIAIPHSDQSVYLRDIVNLRRAYSDPADSPVFFNTRPAVVLSISMVAQQNIDDFAAQINGKIAEFKEQLPLGLEVEYATYQPDLVNAAVHSAVSNLYQTVAVVLVIVMLFLGWRTGLIVGAIVPLTILLTLFIMNQYGIDLQRMSIAAVIIALGLLVDNGIVIVEDMGTRMDAGVEKKEAALQAARSLGLPLLTSSLTTLLAFVPLMLSESVTSEYLVSLSQVIIIALLSSWFLALYVTPVLCYWFLPEKTHTETATNTAMGTGLYKRFLQTVLSQKLLFLGLMLLLLFLAAQSITLAPKQMMPYSDRNQLLIYVDLPAGTDLNSTIASTEKLRAWLNDKHYNPEVTSHIAYIGAGGPRFFLVLSPMDPGDNVAFFVVNTSSAAEVLTVQDRINQFILNEMPEANGVVKRMYLGATEIGLVEYRVVGPEVNQLYKIAYAIEGLLRAVPGVQAIQNSWQNPVSRIEVKIDQLRARRAQVSSESVAKALASYYDGNAVTDYREGDKVIPIILRGGEQRNNLAALLTLPVLSANGDPVPLVQVATFNSIVEPNKLMRENMERTLTVSAKHKTLQATELHEKMLADINNLQLPPGYRIEFGGEIEASEESNVALYSKMPIAFFGIVMLLIWQFNSIRRPAIILLTIPLVLIGASIGLLVTGAFFSFTAILGLFSLAGIIINNGIVLIDRIDNERANGLSVQEATIQACLARMRPIVMTTMTTVLGLIPMMISGGDLWYPMSVVLIFGLAVGTLLTLGVVPVLYVLFFQLEDKQQQYVFT